MAKKGSKNKTVLPDPLPNGLVVTDMSKKQWSLGPSIGVGGFGEIYSATEHNEGSKKKANYTYVVKIEPHGNGPLFCEMHFYMRNAKSDMIKEWCTEKKLSTLGMPCLYGSGSHEYRGKKYRFLVMDRYGKDLWKIFLENHRKFPVPTVYRIGVQILDVLEYIHSKGYVHADIKGANILLGYTNQTENQVFLVDFGLASHYTKKEFKPDPKKAHNGTIEYTSRDAHEGVPTRRGDLEILAYNLIQWMGVTLPWEKNLTDPIIVHNSKKKYMADTTLFLGTCFKNSTVPASLTEFVELVSKMKYDTEPDYNKCRKIILDGAKSKLQSGPLIFKSTTNKHKSEDDVNGTTPEKRRKLGRSKKTISLADKTASPGTTKRGRAKKISEEEKSSKSSSESEEEAPVKKTKARAKKVKEESSDSESEPTPLKKTKGRSNKLDKVASEPDAGTNGGYNAEMRRIQERIEQKKGTAKGKTNARPTRRLPSEKSLNEDIIEATPPEQIPVRRIRKAQTPNINGDDSGSDLTPRTRRERR